MSAGKARKLRVPALHPRGGVVVRIPLAARRSVAEAAAGVGAAAEAAAGVGAAAEAPTGWRPVTTRPAPPAHDPGA